MFKLNKLIPNSFRRIIKRSFHKDVKFGVCFDVDGVIGKGPILIPGAKEAISKLVDAQTKWKVPVVFVTNSSRLRKDRTDYLCKLLQIEVKPWQVIQAPTQLEVYTDFSDKFYLAVEQDEAKELAHENGFKNVCTLEEVSEAYPLLDMVNAKRKFQTFESPVDFPRVEGVVIMGEPIKWERALQLLVDLLRTQGKPTHLPDPSQHHQIPVIVSNFDLEYKSRATIPRFGNGAFLTCLEALYETLTGKKLVYTSVVGKPAEITLRYAEYILESYGREFHGQSYNINTMYMVGDAHKVDVVGANRYQNYIDKFREVKRSGNLNEKEAIIEMNKTLPLHRNIPTHSYFIDHVQNVSRVEALLVRTGVYKEGVDVLGSGGNYSVHESHFLNYDPSLEIPQGIFNDVNGAVDYILQKERYE